MSDEDLRLRVTRLENRFDAMEIALKQNSDATARIETNTQQLVAWIQVGKGFFTVVGWATKAVRWIGGLGLAAAGVAGLIQLFKK